MKRLLTLSAITLSALALSACTDSSNVRKGTVLGFGQQIPDEFTVITRKPLNVPPGFSLRPPKGGEIAQANTKATDVTEIIWNKEKKTTTVKGDVSPSELDLLVQAGATNTDDNVRAMLEQENTTLAMANRTLADKIIFGPKKLKGAELDAEAEKRRLQENKTLGKSILEGKSPIKVKAETTFSKLFD